ncbi:helix-turn-helix transcriptional regulator [Streptomyces sp. NPDC001822]|uniref:helix-turn-helix transcriptional regulator n=1 Tax=Streptomyces sp. NPDC001822 TaxID=3364614 RepID=UPI00369A5AFA
MEYEFLFVVDGIGVDDDQAVGVIFDEFDGLLTQHRGKHLLDLSESGDSAIDAAHRLVVRLRSALPQLRLLRLDPDLVGVSDIAERTGRSRQNVLQWVNGERRAGAADVFPDSEGTVGRSLVWRWAEVNAWLAGLGERVGDAGATREDALHIDFMLPRWQQVLDDGLPIVRFVHAREDERSADRAGVARLLEGTLSAPGLLQMISAFPRAQRQRLTVVCAVLPDRLSAVVSRTREDETCVLLAFQGTKDELRLMPIATREMPGSRPVSELGLGDDATVGDLLLVTENGAVEPTTPVALD